MGIKGKNDRMVVLACEDCKERNYTTVKNKNLTKKKPYINDIWLFRLWASVKLPGGNKFFFWPKPEKNKNTVDIESGTSYTYSVIQIKTCYLI